ncbi:cytochrome oxidase subunit III [Mycobacteroides chelonae]|uniref:cytochrome c oxidase subunit 3 n=1 Tax=Mycobacteroides chelonae TaxID=1774 RepID=UPI0008A9C373|nr:cytochrome c oxidase subunit 3 [Mycobacteroides chelonae]MBF9521801.1 cytochrome oxidase subunit III [Mycobacteroides chelonae]OHU50384.1 cytochrome oxidase subunit III [Mycobacteroides chelonae]PKQ58815.1 cytochrome oxidase subunit III [Mycobacterium sp. MHSD3]
MPGEAELWIFIMGDLTVFGVFFAIWGWNYSRNPAMFELGRASMSQPLGLAETLTLITSSGAVVAALTHARWKQWARAHGYYLTAIGFGSVFVVLKAVEYSRHLTAGSHTVAGEFFMYYFVFTGIHLLHVLVGLLGLSAAARSTRPTVTHRYGVALLEGIGVYWHMVDVLWVVLFALIYLI